MPPLTEKGQKILSSMRETYSTEKKAEEVLYASKNAGRITGIDAAVEGGAPPASQPDPIHSYMDACRRGDADGIKKALKK
jgi:hypothetical protein